MLRNDYRRSLIMLRSLRAGIAGYVRLERRTLIGTMQFTVTGARSGELLYALLLYQVNGLWYAQPIGQLGPARYGQSGLVYRFDPRSIEGRPLESYALVAVASLEEGVCDLVLAGFINGTQEVDWPQVRQAVCQSLATSSTSDRPLIDQGAPIPPIRVPDCCPVRPDNNGAVTLPLDKDEYPVEDGGDNNGVVTLPLDKDEYPVEDGSDNNGAVTLPLDGERPIETDDQTQDGESEETAAVFSHEPRTAREMSEASAEQSGDEHTQNIAMQRTDSAEQSQTETEAQRTDTAEQSQTEAGAQSTDTTAQSQTDAAAQESPSDEFDTPARDSAAPDVFDTPARLQTAEGCEGGCAASELQTDSEHPWPACIEPLRTLFRTRAACRPFEAEGFVMIKAPIAPETGTDYCIAGLSCRDGRPERVLYGIPARYTPEPPAGLEGYIWRGDMSGGYWVIVRPVC